MYILRGESKYKLLAIVSAYISLSIINSTFVSINVADIVTGFRLQYAIFLVCYIAGFVLIKDRNYVLSFGRADDRGFRLAIKTLVWLLTFMSVFSIFYIRYGDGRDPFVQLLQYAAILSLNIIFSQEIKQLIFQWSARN